MKKFPVVAAAILLLLGIGIAQAKDKHAAVPSKILSARTIYVDNQTPDAEMQYEAVMGLSRWARFEIVDTPQKADIVLRLSGSAIVRYIPSDQAPATYEPKPVSENSAGGDELAPPGCTKVAVIEPKSGTTLWSEIRKTNNVQEKSRVVDGLHEAVDQQERSHNR
jgi:hypothetical protein